MMRDRGGGSLYSVLHILILIGAIFWTTGRGVAAAAPEEPASESEPAAAGISSDVFGKRSNRPHLALGLAGGYNDNILNSGSNTLDDYLVVISPGAWFAAPRLEAAPQGGQYLESDARRPRAAPDGAGCVQ